MNTEKSSRIAALDPIVDHCEIVRLTMEDGLIWDFQRSLELGLFRTFAVPSTAKLLHKTGEFEQNGQKRYDDTVVLLINIMQHGYDSEIGTQFLSRMNKTHAHFRIANDDYLFTLSTFVLDPIDWIARFGWRPLTEKEQQALFIMWQQIGIRMGIRAVPQSLPEMRRWSTTFVEKTFVYAEPNAQVAAGTIAVVKSWLPDLLSGFVEPVTATLLDEQTRRSVGLNAPPAWSRFSVPTILKMRGALMRLSSFGHKQPWPDGRRTYPNGYTVDQLAPAQILRAEKEPT